MDLSILLNYINIVYLGICLCIGFAIKPIKTIKNKYIPLIMLITGAILAILTNMPNINAEVILSGMISGLGSTGLYETFKNLIKKEGV